MSAEPLDKEARAEASRDAERATVDTSIRRVYRLIDDNLASVGGVESAAGICGLDRGDLRRALDRKGRYLARPLDAARRAAARSRTGDAVIHVELLRSDLAEVVIEPSLLGRLLRRPTVVRFAVRVLVITGGFGWRWDSGGAAVPPEVLVAIEREVRRTRRPRTFAIEPPG